MVVEQNMELNAFRDELFVFCNKKGDKLKILYLNKTGFALWYKRLGATRSRFIYC
ncbi:MAG: IS66 family insertion sequence element accessory protein TnpB [Paraglaciecola chathamensis]